MAHSRPVIGNDRSALWVFSFLFLGCALCYLWLSWGTWQVGLLLMVLILTLVAGLYFVQASHWRRVHLWRRLAVSEGVRAGVPLARPQPTPNAEALPLLFTITLRPRWFLLLGYTVLLGGAVFILFIFLFSAQNGDTFNLWHWPYALFMAAFFSPLTS